MYKVDDQQLSYVATQSLSSIPKTVAWTHTGELVVVQGGQETVAMFTLSSDDTLEPLGDHPLIEIGKKHKECFEGAV